MTQFLLSPFQNPLLQARIKSAKIDHSLPSRRVRFLWHDFFPGFPVLCNLVLGLMRATGGEIFDSSVADAIA